MINMGGPKNWIHRSAMHFATVQRQSCPGKECTIGRTCPNTPCYRKQFVEPSGDSISKKVHTKCFVEAKGPRQRYWKPRFGRMLFGCTCWTLELSSGTAETKNPQEFLLARVPTVVMEILNNLLLARCQRFLDDSFTVATILIVKRHFVRHYLVSPVTVWVKFVLLCLKLEKNKLTFKFSGPTAISVTRRFFGIWPVRFPNKYTRSCRGKATSSPSNPRVVMDEIDEVRIVHDIEMTLIVQLNSLGGFSKQSVLTHKVELTRPVSGFCRRPQHGQ